MAAERCTSAVRTLDGAALLLQPGRRFGAPEFLQTPQIIPEPDALTLHKVDFLSLTVWEDLDWKHQSGEV